MICFTPQKFTSRNHGQKRMGRQRGFSLIELLIVVAIIIIIVTVAIPNITKSKIPPNEASAVQSMHTIIFAENQYSQTYPDAGYTCNLVSLGPPPRGTPSSPTAADLIPEDLATGTKSGYIFSITGCSPASSTSGTMISYQLTAVPAKVGQTGQKAYCTDQSGHIYYDPSGNPSTCFTSGKPI